MLLVPAVPSFIYGEAQTPQNKWHSVGRFFIGVLKSSKNQKKSVLFFQKL